MTVIPIIVGSVDDGADTLTDLMASECSAKEVVMAVEEVVETLDRRLQSTNEEEEDDDARHASTSRQIVRLIRAYTTCKYRSKASETPLSYLSHPQLFRDWLNGRSPQNRPSSHD